MRCHFVVTAVTTNIVNRLLVRGSSWTKIIRVLAWIIRLCESRAKVFSGPLTLEEVRASKMIIIKEAQKEIELELKEAADSGKGRFRKLAPVKDQEGVWRVGSRLRNYVPFTEDSEMPKILPTNHRTTHSSPHALSSSVQPLGSGRNSCSIPRRRVLDSSCRSCSTESEKFLCSMPKNR